MKSVPVELSNAIRQGYVLNALPRLSADWNMNRYADPTADNVIAEEENGYDVEIFPIEAIVEPIRPTKGICKARINEAVVSDDYGFDGTVSAKKISTRYYIGDVDDVYKYWTGPSQSDATGAIANCAPHVLYGRTVNVNKIVVKLENGWASPKDYTIAITTDGGTTWTTVSTNPAFDNDGQIIIYYNGTAWSTTKPTDQTPTVAINGIQLSVTTLQGGFDGNGVATTYTKSGTVYTTDGTNSNFNLIALEAHLEADLTDHLISTDDTFDMSEVSDLYPIGTLTENSATITLSNTDLIFDSDNTNSPYYQILEPNVEFNLEFVYNVNGVDYAVQQFKMYGAEWTGQTTDTVSIQCADASKYLQTLTPRPAMWENLTVPQIIMRLMDTVGFVDYVIDADDRVVQHTIPVFWVDGVKNAWEILDDLAKGTQSAIYFDGYGNMQVKTRETAYDNTKAASWTLLGQPSGTDLPDIVEWSQTEQFGNNYVTVDYATTQWSPDNNGQPTLTQVWTPPSQSTSTTSTASGSSDNTVVLRASVLTHDLGTNDTFLYIPQSDSVYWLYSGMVQIDGEIISYDGKQFVYYTGSDGKTKNTVVVKSQDEYDQHNKKSWSKWRYKNHLTGALHISERGVWNSDVRQHLVNTNGYSVRCVTGGTHHSNVPGFSQDKKHSLVTLHTNKRMKKPDDLLVATHGATTDSGFYVWGTSIRFNKGKTYAQQRAGIVINSNSGEDGYYIELTPTTKLSGKARAKRNELVFYTRHNDKDKRLGGKGAALAIAENVWYEIDVYYIPSGSDHKIVIYVNGKQALTVTVSGADKVTWNGRFGMFMRGKTNVSYEYLYGIARNVAQPEDDVSFFNLITGGFTGHTWDREWVYSWRTRRRRVKKKWKKERDRFNNYYFDEFGPYVHELREFDIKFDPNPVQYSRFYMTNDWDAICLWYRSNPFGANFVVANAGRTNAVINGADSIEYASTSRQVNQLLTVFGRALVINDAQHVIAKDDTAIQKRGKIESELQSAWIQSEDMAQDIADWMKAHWATGCDTAQVTVFGNPLIEVGDVVAVDYAHKFMTPATHTYFVVGVENAFDTGLTTTLTLRRVV